MADPECGRCGNNNLRKVNYSGSDIVYSCGVCHRYIIYNDRGLPTKVYESDGDPIDWMLKAIEDEE